MEQIMTQQFMPTPSALDVPNTPLQPEHFRDSQFLVFINRLFAFFLSSAVILISFRRQPYHTAALYQYGYASFSNIMSSWCQYEALKFVSFPTQTLGKACKIIPVMIMGRFVSKTVYPMHQYLTATLISLGVSVFLLSRGDQPKHTGGIHGKAALAQHPLETSISGLMLMIGFVGMGGGTSYLTFDSFTSNWQGSLFKQHKMSSIQMMCGVNLFSVLLTLVSLLEQGNFSASLNFLLTHEQIMTDCALMATCSAIGQLIIFFTINQFGPVTFTIIMTIRMALSILLSSVIYRHHIGGFGALGIIITFSSLFMRVYINSREAKLKKSRAAKAATQGDSERRTTTALDREPLLHSPDKGRMQQV